LWSWVCGPAFLADPIYSDYKMRREWFLVCLTRVAPSLYWLCHRLYALLRWTRSWAYRHRRILRGAMPPPELGPNKFQERPFGAPRMQKNTFLRPGSARASLGELTALPRLPSWWGRVWLLRPQELHPRSRSFGPRALALRTSPMTRNRGLGGLDAPSMMGWSRLCSWDRVEPESPFENLEFSKFATC